MTATPPLRLGLAGRGALGHALARAVPSATFVAGRDVDAQRALLAACDVVLLCVPDDAVAPVAQALAEAIAEAIAAATAEATTQALPTRHTGSSGDSEMHAIVAHTSGALPLTALAALRDAGVRTGSWHPLVALPRRATRNATVSSSSSGAHLDAASATAPSPFAGIVTAVDGDPAVRARLAGFSSTLGATALHVPDDARAAWHAAATLVASLPVVSRAVADDLLSRAGLSADATRQAFDALLASVQRNLAATPRAIDALTGPVVRGDVGTLAAHAEVAATSAHADAWRRLIEATIAVAASGDRVTADTLERLRAFAAQLPAS